jgi:two-component system, NarL family, sensor histidine kinase UhpB
VSSQRSILTVESSELGSAALERPIWRLLEDAQDMVYRYRINAPRGAEYLGGAVRDITGHTPAEFYADPDLALKAVHPDDVHLLWLERDRPAATAPVILRWVHADGRIVFAEHRRVPVYDSSSGDLVAIEGIARDVTARVETQQQLRTSQEQMRRLAASLQTAREEERTALSRELHDELGQTLTALKLELGRTADALKGSHSPAVMDRLQSLMGLVEIGVAMVKGIATKLRPPALDHLGLAEAIRWEAATFASRSGLRCHVTADKEQTVLTAKQQTALFRIFQEALTNVVRHAQASAVRVRLTERSRVFELRVSDNGRGITPAEIGNTRAIGLLGMRERATQAGGRLDIAGVPGKGTVITVRVALPARTSRSQAKPRAKARRRRAR